MKICLGNVESRLHQKYISGAHTRDLMDVIRKLWRGEWIKLSNHHLVYPDEPGFGYNFKLNKWNINFEKVLADARVYEQQYPDSSNGKKLLTPIRKLVDLQKKIVRRQWDVEEDLDAADILQHVW